MIKNRLIILLTILMLVQCSRSAEVETTLFQFVPPEQSNVHFENLLHPTEDFNMYIFRNFYNGGGVATGDVTGNGYPDIFLTGNMTSNRLYENLGDFQFRDITDQAGLNSDGYWSTGVSFADVNGNGLLDIFVTLSGKPEGPQRHNRLYFNNGDGTFTEKAKEWGVADENLSTHGVFFDYNGNGLLDLYVVSNSFHAVGNFQDVRGDDRYTPDPLGASKLFRNDGDRFTDVSEELGIIRSVISFGLSAAVSDLNRNGCPDLYIANDFFERDYLYFNNCDGTFTEDLESKIRGISFSSMGSDIADLNNDGWPDIYVLDMLPETEERLKSKMTISSWEDYKDLADRGFHHKYTRNVMQINTGNDWVEVGRYSDVYATDWSWAALLADFNNNGLNDIFVTNGIYKDLLDQDYIEVVANPRAIQELIELGEDQVIMGLMEEMSSVPIRNHMFNNEGDLLFTDRTKEWGLAEPGFSSGAAWADLNGDGSLDLVINNTNGQARIYRNRSAELYPERTWLRVDLDGEAPNTFGIGAQLQLWAGGQHWFREHFLQRGFQSSMQPGLHVGLGEIAQIDSLVLRWPDGRTSRVQDMEVPAQITLSQADAGNHPAPPPSLPTMPGDIERPDSVRSGAEVLSASEEVEGSTENLPEFEAQRRSEQSSQDEPRDADRNPENTGTLSGHSPENLQASSGSESLKRSDDSSKDLQESTDRETWQSPNTEPHDASRSLRTLEGRLAVPLLQQTDLEGISKWKHQRYPYSDFTRERLLMRMRSTEGPALCTGDVNGNGLQDVYIGGARGQSGVLWLQQTGGAFTAHQEELFEADAGSEDIDCLFFDATGNGADDLYVVSGGNSFSSSSSALLDRLYLNDGQGGLSKSSQILPTGRGFDPGSVVAAHDFTGDGNLDLFVGTRLRPFGVGRPANGYLLAGDGQGGFEDVTEQWAPQLLGIGMITDGLWADLTEDGQKELVMVGEWMPVRVFANRGDRFEDITDQLGLAQTTGWWNAIAAGDINGNGRVDLVGANHGLNSMFRASSQAPVKMWAGDFSRNGMTEQILSYPKNGRNYPVALRHDLIAEIPALREKYPDYASYAGQTVEEIFTAEELSNATELAAELLASVVIWNTEAGMQVEELPPRAQMAPMYGIALQDLTGNGLPEIIMGGNLYDVKPQSGPFDGSRGSVLTLHEGRLKSLPPHLSGVHIQGEIRKIHFLEIENQKHLLLAKFDSGLRLFEISGF